MRARPVSTADWSAYRSAAMLLRHGECDMHYGYRVVQARQQTALSVFEREYAPVVIDLVHPGNLGPLPPSRWRLWFKATQLGLVDSHHEWIGGEIAALEHS